MRRTGRRASRRCGGAGTSRCPACCATTSTFRWAAIAGAERARTSIWPIVMLLGGLWHGAKWNFVVVGRLPRRCCSCFERWRGKTSLYSRWPRRCAMGITFVLMLFSWVLFRADNLTLAGRYFGAMFGLGGRRPGIVAVGSRALLAAEPAGDGGLGACWCFQPLQAHDWARAARDLGARRAADPAVRVVSWRPCTPRPSIRSSISSSRVPMKPPRRPATVLVISFLAARRHAGHRTDRHRMAARTDPCRP